MALVPGRFARSAAKRRLRRNESTESHPITISKIYCIRGAVRRAWLVLPLQELHGREWLPVSINSPWLMHLLGGVRNAKHYRGAISNFVRECADTFAKACSQAALSHASSAPPLMDQALSQGTQSKRGRGKILDSDDEADCLVSAVTGPAKPKRQARHARRRPRARRGELMTLSIRGFCTTMTVVAGPKILIPVDESVVQKIVEDLLPRKGEAKHGAKHSADQVIKDQLTEEDRGRVRWRSATRSSPGFWTVSFQDEDGARISSSAGLRVPLLSLAGEELSSEDYQAAALQVLRKARRQWDRLDQSDAERYSSCDLPA